VIDRADEREQSLSSFYRQLTLLHTAPANSSLTNVLVCLHVEYVQFSLGRTRYAFRLSRKADAEMRLPSIASQYITANQIFCSGETRDRSPLLSHSKEYNISHAFGDLPTSILPLKLIINETFSLLSFDLTKDKVTYKSITF
jgi:hypothetical protein